MHPRSSGPSGNTCPRWLSRASSAPRCESCRESRSSLIFGSMGLVKLGQPHPEFGRREQRLAGHNIDVDARFLVIQIFSGSGGLGAVLLRYARAR